MLHIRGRGDAMDMKEIMRRAMSEMARLCNKKLTPQQRREIASMGGKSSWADLTPEQRSAEMKRRARIRKRNKAKARKTDVPSSR